jgi:hypothetical protein
MYKSVLEPVRTTQGSQGVKIWQYAEAVYEFTKNRLIESCCNLYLPFEYILNSPLMADKCDRIVCIYVDKLLGKDASH